MRLTLLRPVLTAELMRNLTAILCSLMLVPGDMPDGPINHFAEVHLAARGAVNNCEMEIRKGEADLRQLDLVLQHHQRERPSVADVLPDNPTVTAWKDRQNLLISRKRELLAYLDSHRSQRAIAQAAERKARNELNEARLHATRREIKEVRLLFEPLRVAIENFDLRCAEIDRTLQQVNEEISRLESLKGVFPDPADEDVQRLNREVERLLKRRGDLIKQKNSAPDRMEAN